MRRLSSRLTFYYKCILPPWFVGCFVFASFMLLTGRFDFGDDKPPPVPIALIFVGLFAAGAACLIYFGTPLKAVWLDADELVVSNYLCKERILVADIVDIQLFDLPDVRNWTTLVRSRQTTIVLKRPSRFGLRIQFVSARGMSREVPPLQALHEAVVRTRRTACTA